MVEQPTACAPAFDGRFLCVDDIGAAVAVCDRQWRIEALSPSAQALLERMGVPVRPLPSSPPEALRKPLSTAPLGQTVEWTPRAAHVDARVGCTPYSLGPDHYMLVMREVSDRHRAVSERVEQERLEATHRLIGSVAHDLRAPLSSIVLNVNMLKRHTTHAPQEVRIAVDDLDLGSTRLCRIVDGLLDYARLGPPVRDVISARESIGSVRRILRATLEERGDTLQTDIAPDANWLIANRFVFEQILVNLVSNASESQTEPTSITVRSRRDGDVVQLEVCDDGPGIDPDLRERIFDPFFSTKADGTGLGLFSAREAARQLGGDLWLDDSGSTRFVLEVQGAPQLDAYRDGTAK
jgi:signal transduction histidine kinase